MPRMRLRRSRDRLGYNEADKVFLLTGGICKDMVMPFGFDLVEGFFSSLYGDDAEARIAWQELRQELLAAFVAANPFRRPYGWWFTASEPRRRLNGRHPFDNPIRTAHAEAAGIPEEIYLRLCFGTPACLFPPQVCDDFDAEYESEADYLERLNLLTADERN